MSKKVDTKEQLISAAISLFSDKGIKGTSLRTITQHSGAANTSAIQYYFGDKQGLVEAVITRMAGVVESAFESELAQYEHRENLAEGNLREVLTAMVSLFDRVSTLPNQGPESIRLLCKLQIDNDAEIQQILTLKMMPVSLRLFQLISRMLPQISLNTLKRKVSFTYITLLFAVATRERSKSATLGNIAVDGEDALKQDLVDFILCGLLGSTKGDLHG